MSQWPIYLGDGCRRDWTMPPAPPWRQFNGGPSLQLALPAEWEEGRPADLERARAYRPTPEAVDLVNAAIFLRRPLLVTGKPGTGKSTLAEAVSHELGLGPVLRWPITSRSTLQDGLYRYDAIGRLQDVNLGRQHQQTEHDIGRYIQLGPLGIALLPFERPRVLLVDEIDKSDVDLPNDLLNVLEEGEFRIPELVRIADTEAEVAIQVEHCASPVQLQAGLVRCLAFPIVVLTSNGERDFPPAFLRRCLRLDLAEPTEERLAEIVEAHLGSEVTASHADLVSSFLEQRTRGDLATDQLLNTIFLVSQAGDRMLDRSQLAGTLLRHLNSQG